ncbi:MAG: hypothetical protein Q8N35_06130 [Methylococcaceae bacterium]|uniref:hypothetical protein n=1 Tax=Methylicorpusculum sp. TaxID=2713644 RepID=UPI002721C53E|nr:hypothetical protein [Methylicorpusculum sp.]MDO9160889.1 hypothetical protein [Methylococcaceae bacterium]MDZ4219063.1 hypothetical protein [Methylobacter sp.]MDP2394124.1 hypothetical protein [Methylococcaceae bacterium]MDP3019147.1 hypothetical protein [Methylococcaceae bacterium]MDP3391720.1 hypothetical protein [Methylococcaceae bacterium]
MKWGEIGTFFLGGLMLLLSACVYYPHGGYGTEVEHITVEVMAAIMKTIFMVAEVMVMAAVAIAGDDKCEIFTVKIFIWLTQRNSHEYRPAIRNSLP